MGLCGACCKQRGFLLISITSAQLLFFLTPIRHVFLWPLTQTNHFFCLALNFLNTIEKKNSPNKLHYMLFHF